MRTPVLSMVCTLPSCPDLAALCLRFAKGDVDEAPVGVEKTMLLAAAGRRSVMTIEVLGARPSSDNVLERTGGGVGGGRRLGGPRMGGGKESNNTDPIATTKKSTRYIKTKQL